MTEQTQQPTDESSVMEPSELDVLKQRADLMGIKYHPNTGVDRLKAKIEGALTTDKSGIHNDPDIDNINSNQVEYLTEKEFKKQRVLRSKQEAGKLIRCVVTCMNPAKKEWEGEIFSVGSSKLGTFKKYVPFNAPDGWHIPKIIYEYIKSKKCTIYHSVVDGKGQKIRKGKLMNEFNIQVLPPLTTKELKELERKQALARTKDVD